MAKSSPMKFKAILSRTTTDKLKSRILSPQLTELTLEVYMSPQEYARIMDTYYSKTFGIEITPIKDVDEEEYM